MYRKVRELSGNFSVCSKVWPVNMSLCERPAGQNLEKSYPTPSHVEFGLGSPIAVLEKHTTQIRRLCRKNINIISIYISKWLFTVNCQ